MITACCEHISFGLRQNFTMDSLLLHLQFSANLIGIYVYCCSKERNEGEKKWYEMSGWYK